VLVLLDPIRLWIVDQRKNVSARLKKVHGILRFPPFALSKSRVRYLFILHIMVSFVRLICCASIYCSKSCTYYTTQVIEACHRSDTGN
jgi:hypothetical protein